MCGHSCTCVCVCVWYVCNGLHAYTYVYVHVYMYACLCVRSQPVCMILISTYIILHNVPANIFSVQFFLSGIRVETEFLTPFNNSWTSRVAVSAASENLPTDKSVTIMFYTVSVTWILHDSHMTCVCVSTYLRTCILTFIRYAYLHMYIRSMCVHIFLKFTHALIFF